MTVYKMATKLTSAKWAFVYWIKSKDWSIVPVEAVLKREMVLNPERIGLVEYRNSGKPPAAGWKKFEARCLAVGRKYAELCCL